MAKSSKFLSAWFFSVVCNIFRLKSEISFVLSEDSPEGDCQLNCKT